MADRLDIGDNLKTDARSLWDSLKLGIGDYYNSTPAFSDYSGGEYVDGNYIPSGATPSMQKDFGNLVGGGLIDVATDPVGYAQDIWQGIQDPAVSMYENASQAAPMYGQAAVQSILGNDTTDIMNQADRMSANSIAQLGLLGLGLADVLPSGKVVNRVGDVAKRVTNTGLLNYVDGPIKRAVEGHNGGPSLLEQDYSGQDILNRIADTPTALSITNQDTIPIGGRFSSVKSQQPKALSQHRSTRIPSDELQTPKNINIEDLLGTELHSIVGDNTGRHTVTGVNGQTFETPIDVKAGFQYTDVDGQGYAGAKTATNSKYNEALTSENPRYVGILMGEQSGDFAQHTNDIYGEMFKGATIAQADISRVDDHIRKIGMSKIVPLKDSNGKIIKKKDGSNKTKSITVRPFENFTSIANPSAVSDYLKALPSGSQRAAFIKGLDRDGMHKLGVPRVSDARLAASDENLVGKDWGTAGYRVIEPDIAKGPYSTTLDQSTTYDTGIDKVGRSQTLTHDNQGIPANLLFSDLSAEQRLKGTGGKLALNSADYKVLESSPKRAKQIVTDKVVDIVSNFTEIERKFGREASLKYANQLLSGGEITGQLIEAARKANAPKWMIAALTGTTLAGGAMNNEHKEQPQGLLY